MSDTLVEYNGFCIGDVVSVKFSGDRHICGEEWGDKALEGKMAVVKRPTEHRGFVMIFVEETGRDYIIHTDHLVHASTSLDKQKKKDLLGLFEKAIKAMSEARDAMIEIAGEMRL